MRYWGCHETPHQWHQSQIWVLSYLSKYHRLATNYAKNYCNRTLIVKVIVENVVTCFLGGTRCSIEYRIPLQILFVKLIVFFCTCICKQMDGWNERTNQPVNELFMTVMCMLHGVFIIRVLQFNRKVWYCTAHRAHCVHRTVRNTGLGFN